ncbi:hypothetical protein CVT26_010554 [Gymnopilus dilepis]|uniref:Uncharacterized protein n=1 Tax=Gymnopilus dilepis TaxID=231916 RepID=A0A409VZ93_9AGAR|nr:hypothetical protein CVT26_010554 [Gymnopilus dilepis]
MAADGVPPVDMWRIFYDFFLDDTPYEVLLAQCRSLIQLSPDMETWKRSKYGSYLRFSTQHTLSEVRRLWASYLEIDSLTEQEKRDLRTSFIFGMQKVRKRGNFGSIRAAGPLAMYYMKAAFSTHKDFWSSGVTPSSPNQSVQPPHINPTFAFCQAGRVFNVHYGTDPLQCFHLAPALTLVKGRKSKLASTTRDLVESAMAQFSSWCTAFRKRVSYDNAKIIIRFFVGESLALCRALRYCNEDNITKTGVYTLPWGGTQIEFDESDYASSSAHRAPLKFNVIDTSNLADHTGLLNLILVTTPLLQKLPWSVLHTNTLLPSNLVGVPSSGLASRALADIPTLSMILGIAPSSSLSHFTTFSNKPEIVASSVFSGQLLEPISWKFPSHLVPASMLQTATSEASLLAPDGEKLGKFLFSVYTRMFSEEDILDILSDMNRDKVQKQITVHYVRESLVAFFKHVKDEVHVDWPKAISTFFSLLEADRKLITGLNYYQDLICHLYVRDLYTPETMEAGYVQRLGKSHPLFKGWKDTPAVVCIVLEVPRSALQPLEDMDADEILTPVLQCETRVLNGHNIHPSIQPVFGHTSLSYVEGEPQVHIIEDQRGWQGNSPLLVSFYMPTWIILSYEPKAVSVGLHVRSNPTNTKLLVSKLGLTLALYSTNLSDEKHVRIIRYRPDNFGEVARLRNLSVQAESRIRRNEKVEGVSLNFDKADAAVMTMTIRHDVLEPAAAKKLSAGVDVKIQTLTDTILEVSFGGISQKFVFPFPAWGKKAKCRIARKSSYIEIEAPVRASLEDVLDFSTNPFPVIYHKDVVNNINIHYVNLDVSPALDLPMNKDKLDWLRSHFGMALSQYEKDVKERPDQGDRGVLVNIKESITALFYNYTGIDGPEKQSKIFGLTDPTNGGVYTLIFVNDIKLDLASHTLIADACAVPLYRALMVKISPALQRLTDRGLNQIVTLSDEAKVWRLLLPVVAERCRT